MLACLVSLPFCEIDKQKTRKTPWSWWDSSFSILKSWFSRNKIRNHYNNKDQPSNQHSRLIPLHFYSGYALLLHCQFPRSQHSSELFTSPSSVHLASAPQTKPWSPASRGEAIYSNHRDPARAPQSPRGLIGNQRERPGGREREK